MRDQGLLDELGLTAYERPSVYTSVAAPTHDRNLRSLSKNVETSLLFGHVRAAGPGASVHEYNCHPFACGRYMFMHNGEASAPDGPPSPPPTALPAPSRAPPHLRRCCTATARCQPCAPVSTYH